MGASLTGAMFVYIAHEQASGRALSPNERLLLLFMAHTARDTDPTPRYFGSRERSAVALGRTVPDAPSTDDPDFDMKTRERDNAFTAVKTAVRGLVRRGAIERLRRGRAGQRAEFALRAHDRAMTRGKSEVLHQGRPVAPFEGKLPIPLRGAASIPPRTTRGTSEEQGEGLSRTIEQHAA